MKKVNTAENTKRFNAVESFIEHLKKLQSRYPYTINGNINLYFQKKVTHQVLKFKFGINFLLQLLFL